MVELSASGGSAEAMPAFYKAATDAGDEASLLAAAPDHWVLCKRDDGIQQVIETTGGSPLASRIFLDENEVGPIGTPADPSFPVQWVAHGRPLPVSSRTGSRRRASPRSELLAD